MRELVMLVSGEGESENEGGGGADGGEKPEEALKWYYVSDQEPDEVLLIKFFDSASLGDERDQAGGPYNGSPGIGDAGVGEARESIEVRVVAFW